MGEKTEKATPKKLRDARKKGQVAKSQDFPSAFTFVVSVSLVLAMAPRLYEKLGGFLVTLFSGVDNPNLQTALVAYFQEGILTIFTSSIPILIMVVCVGVLVNFLMVGPTLALEAFKPDIKKFDPIQNLKSKFKMKTLVELLKSLLKILIAGYVVYSVMYKSLPVLTTAVTLPMAESMLVLHYFLMEVVVKVGIIFFVIGVMDLMYQRHVFANEMKMEKFEVKQEFKNTEGDPQIKSKRKEQAREIAYSDGPSQNVRKAKAVVTNPTHIAVALGYDKELDPCPFILEMGQGSHAELIMKLADKYDVPVMRNVGLARQLWEQGEIWAYVPKSSYEAVAEILRWIAALESEKEALER